MARYRFGGGVADWTLSTVTVSTVPNVAQVTGGATITFWSAETAGDQYTDLLDSDGAAVSTIVSADGSIVRASGQIPPFSGPDGVREMWASANGGPRALITGHYPAVSRSGDTMDGPLVLPDGSPAASEAYVGSAVAAVVLLPPSNGADDTAAINTILADHAGKTISGRPGSAYRISAPLVIYSGTTLDMTSCTVTLLPGSNCNMMQNRAVATVRRVLDAATTSGSATLTSASGAFTSADVGKPITVQGAGAAGAPLTTTIGSVTNGTTAILAATAGATATGQYAAVGARDSDITIVGGTWDRAANGSVPVQNSVDAHSLRFRHIDRLTIRDLTCLSAQGGNGKYQINPGDCTDVTVRDISFPLVGSDGVHFNGPCRQIVVRNIIGGTLDDDLVSFTARDTYVPVTDVAGDITDVVVDSCMYKASGLATSSVLKIVAGQNSTQTADYVCRNFRATNLTGPSKQGVVCVGDNVPVGGNGGQHLDITIDGVRSLGGGEKPGVYLRVGIMDRITVRNVDLSGAELAAVWVEATVGRLMVSDMHWSPSGATSCVYVNGGTVDTLIVSRVQGNPAGGAALLRLESTATVGRLIMSQVDLSASASAALIDYITSAASIGKVTLSGMTLHNINYPLGSYRSNVTVTAGQVIATGMNSWTRARDAAVVTVVGAHGMSGDVDFLVTDTGTVVNRSWASNVLDTSPDALANGEEALPRLLATSNPQLTSGTLILTYFTARKTESVPNVVTITRDVAATGTTLARVGVYSVAANGDLALVASIPNDTTLWSVTAGRYSKALSAALAKVAGRRYAVGVLWVGSGTAPRLAGVVPVSGAEAARSPAINGSVTGQADLPASITAGSIGSTAGISLYAALI